MILKIHGINAINKEGGYESVNLRYGAVAPIPLNTSTAACGNFTSAEFDLATMICAGATISPTCNLYLFYY
jgi:hypothetical protein